MLFMRLMLPLFLSFSLMACGGDYTAAVADVTFTPIDEDPSAAGEADPVDPAATPADDPLADPGVEDPNDDPVEDPVDDPVEDPVEDPVDDPEDPVEDPSDDYDPDWTDHDDPGVEGCLEAFPAICNKVEECGAEQPVLQLLGGFCPSLFDSISPMLIQSCEQVSDLLGQALPGVEIPLAGNLGDIITKLMTGCIENFQCDPEYLATFGEKLGAVLQLFGGLAGGGGGGGGGGDIAGALPALLELAEMCGGLGNLLPF